MLLNPHVGVTAAAVRWVVVREVALSVPELALREKSRLA
jgi:hypothetical protein